MRKTDTNIVQILLYTKEIKINLVANTCPQAEHFSY